MKVLTSFLSLILVSLTAGALGAQTITVDKTSLTFSAQAGGSAVAQTLTFSGSGSYFIASNVSWLRFNGDQSAALTPPATITVAADPAGLTAGTHVATIQILGANINIPVTFMVGNIGISPASLSFSYQLNGTITNASNLTLASATTIAYTATATTSTGGNWLTVPAAGTSPGPLPVSLNGSVVTGLAVGSYNGTVTITPASGPAISAPVTLTVAAAPTVTANPATVNLNYQIGGASGPTNNASTVVTLRNPGVQDLLFGIATTPSGTWLSATSSSTTIPAGGTAQITVSYATAQNLTANTYTGQVRVFISGAANSTIDIPVNLRVSQSPLLNVPGTTLNFTHQVGAGNPASQNVVATSSAVAADAGSGQMVLVLQKSDNSNWLTIPATGLTGSANPIVVAVNPAGLAVGTYNATISVFGNGAANNPQTIPVTLRVSNDPLIVASFGGCSTANTTCPLNFAIQTGQPQTTTQSVRVVSSTGAQASFTATPTMTTPACGNSWLSVGATATVDGAEATYPITVAPGAIAAGTTCEGSITIAGTNPATGAALPNSPVSIPVRMYVSSNPLLVASPVALHFTLPPNQISAQQQITVTSTGSNIDYNATASVPWLLVFPLAASTTTGQNAINVAALSSNPATMNPGTYSATITLTATTAGVQNSPLVIPVTLTVSAATLTVTPTTLSFTQVVGGTPPAAQTFRVSTSSTDINFTTNVTTQQGTGWLSATPSSGTATQANPAAVSVNVNGANLPAGTYQGTVTITAPNASGSPANVNVTLVVQPGTVSASPATLTFNQVQGGSAPAAQTITVSGTPGALPFTIAAATNTGGSWLSVTPASGTTNGTVQVTANAGTLTAGEYNGTVTITSTGAAGSPISIPVRLNVLQAATFTVSQTSLNFSHVVGAPQGPAPQTVQLTASAAGVPFSATAQTESGGNWLSVSPANGNGSSTLNVLVNTQALLVGGTYTGTIRIASPNAVTNPAATINVTITVTQVPKPVILSVANAASYISGAVSPGENIVIFGTGIGPATLTTPTGTITSFPTTLANTQVFFDNIPAPIIYARADQTSVMVPFGVAGRTTTSMRIVYSGVSSDPIPYNVAAAAPGIYTANASGSGQGAILNQDYTFNGSAAPAAKGSVVTVYLTGEGVTSPAGTDGRIAPIDGTGLFKPVLPVTATVDGQPATVEYYGTAPGILYGVMQANIRIPANARSGNLSVSIGVGSNATQPNVTVAVQ